jgi:glycosyltransferase involved in cell wall biosynthesis
VLESPSVRGRLRLLHAIHDFLPRHRAGSEIYAFELGRALERRAHHVSVVAAEYDPTRPHGSLHWRTQDGLPVIELVNNWAFGSFAETYRSPQLTRALEQVLRAVEPHVLHVHNLLNLSFDLPAVARARGIPTVATLHDHTLVCPSGGQRLHVADRFLCREIDPARCARCFAESPFQLQLGAGHLLRRLPPSSRVSRVLRGVARAVARRYPTALRRLAGTAQRAGAGVTARDIETRLAAARRVFEDIELFVAPSAALADEFRRLGVPPSKLRVSDYGFVHRPAPRRAPQAAGRLRVGFVGTLVWHKGVHVLLEAVARLPRDRVELKVFGDPEVFPAYSRSLRDLAADLPVVFAGGFTSERTPEIYAQLDVLIVPSLWLENSPLVIHEAFMAGIPVVGSRLGGIPELVVDGVSGLVVEAGSSDALARALQRLLDEPDLLPRLAAGVPAVKAMESDAGEWEAIYGEVLDRSVRGASAAP